MTKAGLFMKYDWILVVILIVLIIYIVTKVGVF